MIMAVIVSLAATVTVNLLGSAAAAGLPAAGLPGPLSSGTL